MSRDEGRAPLLQADGQGGAARRRKMSDMGAALVRGSFPAAMQMPQPIINVLIFFEGEAPSLEVMARCVEENLWPNHRFHSCCNESGYWEARHAQMDRAYHFREQQVPDEAAIDAFANTAMMQTLDSAHPPWQCTLLRAPAPGRSACFFRIHHAIGDGLGLLFAFAPTMGCEGGNPLSKVPLPALLLPKALRPPRPAHVEAGSVPRSRCFRRLGGLLASVRLFFKGLFLPLMVKADSETSFSPPLAERTPFLPFNGQRSFIRLPSVPMTSVKVVTKQHGCSVNDALMAALAGALRRYGLEVHQDKRIDAGGSLEFKSMLMIGLPRPVDERNLVASLCNNMLFASCPLPVNESTARGRLRRVVAACNNLKSKAYMTGLIGVTNFIKGIAPPAIMRKAASETMSKHTLLVSSVPSPTVPITWPKEGGAVMDEVQMVFPNAITQVSMVTYNGSVHANLVADGRFFPDPAALGRMWLAEFEALAEP